PDVGRDGPCCRGDSRGRASRRDRSQDHPGRPARRGAYLPGACRQIRGDPMTGPLTYHEAMELSLRDQVDRYEELTDRDLMARSIASLRARGEYDEAMHPAPDRHRPPAAVE